jgi:hypothetical protein
MNTVYYVLTTKYNRYYRYNRYNYYKSAAVINTIKLSPAATGK